MALPYWRAARLCKRRLRSDSRSEAEQTSISSCNYSNISHSMADQKWRYSIVDVWANPPGVSVER